jgi:hypothetical protein
MADTAKTPSSNPEAAVVAFDERTRRVLELRKQVREGTYRPDPSAVAEALLREWELFSDLLDEAPALMPSVGTSMERRATAAGRFVVEPSERVDEADEAKAV